MDSNAWNLPGGWKIKTSKSKHISEPPNTDIANAFFRAGYIEIWGEYKLFNFRKFNKTLKMNKKAA